MTGTMLCTRHTLPAMIERRHRRIINLSSQLAQRAVGGSGIVLASDEAGYLTGQILHPSGGWVSG